LGSPGALRASVAGAGRVSVFLDRGEFAQRLASSLRSPTTPPRRPGGVIVDMPHAVLGDSFVRILRSRGHEVVAQNYIDDTGVQVADVVVGFEHLEKKSFVGSGKVFADVGHPRLAEELSKLRADRRGCRDVRAKFACADPLDLAREQRQLHSPQGIRIGSADAVPELFADQIARAPSAFPARVTECWVGPGSFARACSR
jgi:hypothetical protein